MIKLSCGTRRAWITATTLSLLMVGSIPAAQEVADRSPAPESTAAGPEVTAAPEGPTPPNDAAVVREVTSLERVATGIDPDTPLRLIGMFASQMADLVPENFRPMAIDDLEQLLLRQLADSVPAPVQPMDRFRWAAIIDGEILRSVETRLDLPTWDDPTVVRSIALGKLSGAISIRDDVVPTASPPSSPESSPSSRSNSSLGVDVSGSVWVSGRSGSSVGLDWSLVGRPLGGGVRWDLTIPSAMVKECWVAVPEGQQLTSPNAIVMRESTPPAWVSKRFSPDRGSRSENDSGAQRATPRSWVRIEVSAASPVTLILSPPAMAKDQPVVVRGCRWQAEWRSEVLRWQCRLVLDRQTATALPPIELIDGELDAVQWMGRELPFTSRPKVSADKKSKIAAGRGQTIQWDAASLATLPWEDPGRSTRTLTLSGHSVTRGPTGTGRFPLPQLNLDPQRFLVVPDRWQFQLTVPNQLNVVDWHLPGDWTVSASSPTVWKAQGSPPPMHRASESSSPEWSVDLAAEAPLRISERWLRLEVQSSAVRARQRIQVQMPPGTLAPVTLELQPGFTIESIIVAGSQRVVTPLPNQTRSGRWLIWPTPDEVVDATLTIHVEAQATRQAIEKTPNRLESMWLARVRDCPGRLTSAIIPPASMSWSPETAIDPQRIDFGDLDAAQRAFLAPLPGDAIVFGGAIDVTPPLSLETPDISLSVSTRTTLTLFDRGLEQVMVVRPEAALTNVDRLRVAMVMPPGQPPPTVVWSMQASANQSPVTLTEAAVTEAAVESPSTDATATNSTIEPASVDGVRYWSLPVPRGFTFQSRWIGRCVWPTATPWTVGLPTLPEATAHAGEVWVDRRLRLLGPAGVLNGVPSLDAPRLATESTATTSDPAIGPSMAHWRYAIADRPTLEVATRQQMPPGHLVTQQRVVITASAFGADSILGDFRLYANSPIRLRFPSSMQLSSVHCNGIEVPWVPASGGGVWIKLPDAVRDRMAIDPRDPERAVAPLSNPAEREPADVSQDRSWGLIDLNVVWRSQSPVHSPARKIEDPVIVIDGLTLQSETAVIAAEDSYLLRAPWLDHVFAVGSGMFSASGENRLPSRFLGPTTTPDTIVPRRTRLAWMLPLIWLHGLGWIGGLVVMASAWSLLARRPRMLLVAVALALLALALWPAAALPLAAFVLLPMTLAALIQSTHTADAILPSESDTDAWSASPARDPSTIDRAVSGERRSGSWSAGSSIVRSPLMVLIAIGLGPVESSVAQATGNAGDRTPAGQSDPRGRIDVLVPLRSDGEPLGNKVYVPESLYERRFSEDAGQSIASGRLWRADYQVQLAASARSSATRAPDPFRSDQPDRPDAPELDRWSSSLTVELGVTTDQPTEQLRLPYPLADVLGVSLRMRDGGRRELRLPENLAGPTVIDVPENDRFELSLRLRSVLASDSEWLRLSATLPPIPLATLTIAGDASLGQPMIHPPMIHDAADGDIDAPPRYRLGDARDLTIRWAMAPADTVALPTNTRSMRRPLATPLHRNSVWQRRVWVHVAERESVIEWELQPQIDVPANCTVQFATQAPEGAVRPMLLGQDWSWETGDQPLQPNATLPAGTSTTQIYRVRRQSDSLRPLRLAWSVSLLGDRARDASAAIDGGDAVGTVDMPTLWFTTETLTDGRASGDADSARRSLFASTWVAYTFADGIQPLWNEESRWEPLPVDQFYAQWSGYLGKLDRCVTAIGPLEPITVRRRPAMGPALSTTQQIHVDSLRRRIDFEVQFAPGISVTTGTPDVAAQMRRYAIVLPPGSTLLQWQMNGPGSPPWTSHGLLSQRTGADPLTAALGESTSVAAPAHWAIHASGNQTELIVDCPSGGLTVGLTAEVTTNQPREPFDLPVVRVRSVDDLDGAPSGPRAVVARPFSTDEQTVAPEIPSQRHELVVTRSAATRLTWMPPPSQPAPPASLDAAALLADGKLLEGVWVDTASMDTAFGTPRVRWTPFPQAFDADVRLTLRWEDGRWTAVTHLEITSPTCPDFVDVEMPTRWCDSLSIEPVQSSSRQPTLDPARQVIRISLLPTTPGGSAQGRSVRLISRLIATDVVRVGVPKVRLISARQTRFDLSVPNRLTNEPVRWRTAAVRPIDGLRWKLPGDGDAATEDRTVYAMTGPAWSIELETLPQTDVPLIVLHADHQLLNRASGTDSHLISRFDLLPGDATMVQLSVPAMSGLVGVWSAGQPADLLDENPDQSALGNGLPDGSWRTYSVVLPLHRLGQSLEVLTHVGNMRSTDELPRCLGVTTVSTSVACWQEPLSRRQRHPATGEATLLAQSDRWHRLASSVVRAVAASSDSLADRRDDEVAAWLRPWVRRFVRLSLAAGRDLSWLTESSSSTRIQGRLPSETELEGEAPIPWESLNAFIAFQSRRYLIDLDIESPTDLFRAEAGWMRWLAVTAPETFDLRWVQPNAASGERFPLISSVNPFPWDAWAGDLARVATWFGLAIWLVTGGLATTERQRSLISRHHRWWLRHAREVMGSPACWLFVLGLVGYWVMPMPIALALMLTALVLGGFDPLWFAIRKRWSNAAAWQSTSRSDRLSRSIENVTDRTASR